MRRGSIESRYIVSKQYKRLSLNCHKKQMHPMFPFPNIVFKHPVALIYHSFHIYFHVECNLLHSHPSSTSHISAVYGHHQVFYLAKIVALYVKISYRV
jgi:hypothetical protein